METSIANDESNQPIEVLAPPEQRLPVASWSMLAVR